jgi:hypothetical protein
MAVMLTERAEDQRPAHRTDVAPAAPPRTLEVLFIIRSLTGYLRFFRSPLELLVERGHNVRLLVDRATHGEVEQAWLDRMREAPNFRCDIVDHLGDPPWNGRRQALRRGIEYVRVLKAGNERSAVHFRKRWGHAPKAIRRLADLPVVRTRTGLRMLYAALSTLDRLLQTPPHAVEYIEALRPDVVALCDYGHVGSLYSLWAKVAKERGIPVAICVATWDNLSSRQKMDVVPHALLVWNETQRREALEIHGIPAERVVLTGAPCFDPWFTWKPRPRSEFLARPGLDPERPVILWLGGALYKAEQTEAEYARAWLAALRAADDQLLREAGVLLRPHPRRVGEWTSVDFSAFENAVVWPTEGHTFPVAAELKADYFDSIYHAAAVVGLNTSAMIEAAIVGRPVLTILDPDWHDSQLGTYHFSYLLEADGGPVRAARTLEEQFAALSRVLAGHDAVEPERARSFLTDFVRPHGLEKPATPIFVHTLEQLADVPVAPEPDPLVVRAARRLLMLAVWIGDPLVVRQRLRRVRSFWRRYFLRPAHLAWRRVRSFWRRYFLRPAHLAGRRVRAARRATRRFWRKRLLRQAHLVWQRLRGRAAVPLERGRDWAPESSSAPKTRTPAPTRVAAAVTARPASLEASRWLPSFGWWPHPDDYALTVVLSTHHATVDPRAKFHVTLRGYAGSSEPVWEHEVGHLKHGEERAVPLEALGLPEPPAGGGVLEVHTIRLDSQPTKPVAFVGMWIDARGRDGGGYLIPTIPIRGAAKVVKRDDLQVAPGVMSSREVETELVVLNVVEEPVDVRFVVSSAAGLVAEGQPFSVEPWSAWHGSLSNEVPRARQLLAQDGGVGSLAVYSSLRILPYFGFRRPGQPITCMDHMAPIFA